MISFELHLEKWFGMLVASTGFEPMVSHTRGSSHATGVSFTTARAARCRRNHIESCNRKISGLFLAF